VGWYEAMKDAISVADRLRDAELKQKLANVQIECAKLSEENAQLRLEVHELREQIRTRQTMEFRDDVYWRNEDGQLIGPICPKCFDGERRETRMSIAQHEPYWQCAVCDYAVSKPKPNTHKSSR
jgi:hypothetical protein